MRRRWRQRELSPPELRFAAWLEGNVPMHTMREQRTMVFEPAERRRGRMLYNARALVGRYGRPVIALVLSEMIYTEVEDFRDTGGRVWFVKYWNDELVSPAQFLVWRIKQEAEEADEEGR